MTFLPCRLLATLGLFAGLAVAPDAARAAQSYDSCTGFIDSLPATISTQGVWCLQQNLSTNITNGAAITIATNNVTIDCNDFKLGGLAAGNASSATGILADDRQNATLRHCNVRGFRYGIRLTGGAGHLVEDNTLDNNLQWGIQINGDNSLVQRNRVYDTGGSPDSAFSYGIVANGDVIDNTVTGVFATAVDADATGILLSGRGSVARANRVSGLEVSGNGFATGINANDAGTTIDGNHVAAPDPTSGVGITGDGVTRSVCSHNVVTGFGIGISGCLDNGGNVSL